MLQFEVDEGRRQGLSSDEREELRKLRRENSRLREEREIFEEGRGTLNPSTQHVTV